MTGYAGKDLKDAVVTLSNTSYTYNGKAQCPKATLTYDGENLNKGTDYESVLPDPRTNAGEYTITFNGKGDFDGTSTTATYTIEQATFEPTLTVEDYAAGETAVPQITGVPDNFDGTPTVEYLVNDEWTATAPTEEGEYEAKATFTGATNYKDTAATANFKVTAAGYDLADAEVTLSWETREYSPDKKTAPKATLTYDGETLEKDTDYESVLPEEPEKYSVGVHTITFNGLGRFEGTSTTAEYEITPLELDLANVEVSLDPETYTYNGERQVPKAALSYEGTELERKVGYTSEVPEQGSAINAGDYEITIKANEAPDNVNGNYALTGEQTITYTIEKADFEPTITVEDCEVGETPEYELGGVPEDYAGGDPTIEYSQDGESWTADAPTEKGTWTARATYAEDDNYNGATAEAEFTVSSNNLADAEVTLTWETREYSPDNKTAPKATLTYDGETLKKGTDYESVLPEEPEKYSVGVHTITFNGLGRFEGTSTTAEYEITPVTLKIDPTALTVEKTYDGNTSIDIDTIEGLDQALLGVKGTDEVDLVVKSAEYGDKNASTSVSVTATFELAGEDASNYVLSESELTFDTGIINPKPVMVLPQDSEKVYGEQDPDFTQGVQVVDEEGQPGLIPGDSLGFGVEREQGEDVGIYTISTTKAEEQTNYDVTYGTAAFKILAKDINISGIKALPKDYDGTPDAEFETTFVAEDVEGADITAAVLADGVGIEVEGEFVNKNVFRRSGEPANKRVNITGVTLTGEKASNYNVLSFPEKTSAMISPLGVYVDGITCDPKTYDGTTDAPLNWDELQIHEIFEGDDVDVDLQSLSGEFEDRHVAYDESGETVVAKTVNIKVDELELTGDDAGNYFILTDEESGAQLTTEGTISPRDLTITGLTAEDKYYDGNTDAVLNWDGELFFDGLVGLDEGLIKVANATGHFEAAGVSEQGGQLVIVDSVEIEAEDDAQAGDYTPKSGDHDLSAQIKALPVTVTVDEGQSKVYGEEDPALTATVTDDLTGEVLDPSPVEFEPERAVGEDVDEYEITFKDPQAEQGNYTVSYVEGIFTITPASIEEATIEVEDVDYNAQDQEPELTVTLPDGTVLEKDKDFTAEYSNNHNAGEATVTITGINNYEGTASTTFNINKADLTVDGIKVDPKNYDGNTSVPEDKWNLEDVTFTTVLGDDEITIASVTGEYNSKNVDATTVYAHVELAGDETTLNNYNFLNPDQEIDAQILPAEATVTPSDTKKTYGDPDPNVEVTVEGLIAGESLSYTYRRDPGEDVGEYTIHTEAAEGQTNYNVTYNTATFTIEAKEVTVSGISANDKVYDGTTYAELVFDNAVVDAPAFEDVLTVTADGAFEDKNVAYEGEEVVAKTVNISNIKLEGAKAGNYVLAEEGQQETTSATITPAPVTVSGITASDKDYDGDTKAMINTSAAEFETLFGEDEVEVVFAEGNFEDENVSLDDNNEPADKVVNITGIELGGTDGANYYVDPEEGVQATASAKIKPIKVTVSGIATEDKDYDGTDAATLNWDSATITGLLEPDEGKVVVASATGHFADPNAGTAKSVVIDEIVLGPAEGQEVDKSVNYYVEDEEIHAAPANINALQVTVTADNKEIVYGDAEEELTATVDPEGTPVEYELTCDQDGNVGEYAITFVNPQRQQGNGNYEVTFVDGTYTINHRDATVQVDPGQGKTYGDADPEELTYTAEGFVNGEEQEEQYTFTCTREEGEDAGAYAITFDGHEGTEQIGNYNIQFLTDNFIISPRNVTITVQKDENASKVYGDKDPTFAVTYEDKDVAFTQPFNSGACSIQAYVGGDKIDFTLEREKGEDAGQTYDVWAYGDWAQSGHGDDSENYIVSYVSGKFDINYRAVTIKANDASKEYKAADPALTATVKGVTKGDTVTYTLTREKGEKAGKYAINAEYEEFQGGYQIVEFIPGTFTIKDPSVVDVQYSTHVQDYGWLPTVSNGTFSGTTGQCKRMEALTVKLPDMPYAGHIKYRSHLQNIGWETDWKYDGAMSGTYSQSRRLEAVQIQLEGEIAKHYSVYYRLHVQNYGWMAWTSDGLLAGTQGKSLRAEAIQIVIVRKGDPAPSANYKGVAQATNKAFIK